MCHKIDVRVGRRIRQRRWLIGMTQQHLAERVGLKFQQIHKYEKALSRVSATRLWNIAAAQSVHIAYYFEGLIEEEAIAQTLVKGIPQGFSEDKRALTLICSYYAIPEIQRRQFLELARAIRNNA